MVRFIGAQGCGGCALLWGTILGARIVLYFAVLLVVGQLLIKRGDVIHLL